MNMVPERKYVDYKSIIESIAEIQPKNDNGYYGAVGWLRDKKTIFIDGGRITGKTTSAIELVLEHGGAIITPDAGLKKHFKTCYPNVDFLTHDDFREYYFNKENKLKYLIVDEFAYMYSINGNKRCSEDIYQFAVDKGFEHVVFIGNSILTQL